VLSLNAEPEIEPLKEASLSRHLSDVDSDTGGEEVPDTEESGDLDTQAEPKEAEEGEEGPLALEDYQLSEALNVLKGLTILGSARDG
jgi:carboxyl-terminal processing protease